MPHAAKHPNTDGAIFVPLPSGRYAAYIPQDRYSRQNASEIGPIVQVAQLIDGHWHGTPAQYHAKTASVAATGERVVDRVVIDGGQRWMLDTADTAVFRAFAAGVYLAWEEERRLNHPDTGPGTGATIDELRELLSPTGWDAKP
jgi:hypothetical protein